MPFDLLHDSSSSVQTTILATDLDGTFLGGSPSEQARLHDWIQAHRSEIVLIYVSGRSLSAMADVLEGLPVQPDHIISDVGTAAYAGKSRERLPELENWLDTNWPADATSRIRRILQAHPHLREQPLFEGRRFSCFYSDARLASEAKKELESAGFDVLMSAGRFFDVLPHGVQKGSTLLRMLDTLGLSGKQVLVAGDTLNDLSLFRTGLRGVVVANREPALAAAVQGLPNVMHSTREGAAGVLGALRDAHRPDPKAGINNTKILDKKLIVVYHRQPYEERVENGKPVLREPRSPNGIIPAIKGFFGYTSEAVWISWKRADSSRKMKESESRLAIRDNWGNYEVVRIPLEASKIHQFYHVVSKEALWPAINSFAWLYSSEKTKWSDFREVNRRFAQKACEEAETGSIVWIHDYNLWLVPGFIRKMRDDLKVAFFHHTQFPGPDVFNILPWRDEIIDSLLSCDQIGFHVPRYVQNFCQVVQSLRPDVVRHQHEPVAPIIPQACALFEPLVTHRLELSGRDIRIDTAPIGTSPEVITEIVRSPEGQARARRIREEMDARILVVSVGRVDYVKGARQQLEAYDRLLRRRPELQGQIKLLLVTVAAAEGMEVYRSEQQKIEQLVGRINGHHGTLHWQPIHHSTTALSFEEVICAYRAADIAWITPLRDGLNLVAKEFIAAKQGDPGVLVLSEFSGVAMELKDAILVNPFSRSSLDLTIDQAIDMPEDERRGRMERMLAQVHQYDIRFWTKNMLDIFAGLQDPAEV